MKPEPDIQATTPCPDCPAGIGDPCVSPSGRVATLTHHSRWLAWRLAGRPRVEAGVSS